MKKKIPFDVGYREKVESGEVSVVTRDDHPVRIICWDADSDWSICALIKDYNPKSTYGYPQMFDKEGKCIERKDNDLFLLVECELTEFEEACRLALLNWCDPTEWHLGYDFVREQAAALLEAARKALRPEFDKELEQAYRNQDDVVYRKGYETGFLAASEIDMEKLTDQIAEKVAAAILKDGNPFAPNPAIPYPGNPLPWTDPASPCEPITVMYGVTPVKFRATVANTPPSGDASAATTISDKED